MTRNYFLKKENNSFSPAIWVTESLRNQSRVVTLKGLALGMLLHIHVDIKLFIDFIPTK